jgi:hypothetical protein
MFDISSKRGRPMYRNTCTASLRDLHQIRQLSRAIALTSLMLGAASGLVLGLWAFGGPLPKPAWFGDYGETSRRLFRLGHIAISPFSGSASSTSSSSASCRRWP